MVSLLLKKQTAQHAGCTTSLGSRVLILKLLAVKRLVCFHHLEGFAPIRCLDLDEIDPGRVTA